MSRDRSSIQQGKSGLHKWGEVTLARITSKLSKDHVPARVQASQFLDCFSVHLPTPIWSKWKRTGLLSKHSLPSRWQLWQLEFQGIQSGRVHLAKTIVRGQCGEINKTAMTVEVRKVSRVKWIFSDMLLCTAFSTVICLIQILITIGTYGSRSAILDSMAFVQ